MDRGRSTEETIAKIITNARRAGINVSIYFDFKEAKR